MQAKFNIYRVCLLLYSDEFIAWLSQGFISAICEIISEFYAHDLDVI